MSENREIQVKEQVRHLVGLAALMDWRLRWKSVRKAVVQEGDTLTLGLEPSARFALALPRRSVVGRVPVLLVQPDEAEWIGLINWNRIHVEMSGSEGYLSLVARRQLGVGENLPDLPAFAVRIQLQGVATGLPFHEFPHIDIRRYWHSEGEWQIEGGRAFRQLPISPARSALFMGNDRVLGATFQDRVREHSKNLPQAQPIYQGAAADLSHLSEDFLLKASTVFQDQ